MTKVIVMVVTEGSLLLEKFAVVKADLGEVELSRKVRECVEDTYATEDCP